MKIIQIMHTNRVCELPYDTEDNLSQATLIGYALVEFKNGRRRVYPLVVAITEHYGQPAILTELGFLWYGDENEAQRI